MKPLSTLAIAVFIVASPGLAYSQADTPAIPADPCDYQKTLQEARQLPNPCSNDAGCAARTQEVVDKLTAAEECEMRRLAPPVYYLQPESREGLTAERQLIPPISQ